MIKKIKVNSLDETQALGIQLGKNSFKNCVITLSGDLGAGKTTLTQGIAKGLEITRTISSPTFTILKIYQGRLPLYHFDAYRLEGSNEDLGFEEMIDGDGVAVIEWPQYMEREIPKECLKIVITRLAEEEREFVIESVGERYDELLEALL